MKSVVQFGAGNVGRAVMGQMFARGGFSVTFVDVSDELVAELKRRGEYRVIVKQTGRADAVIPVAGVRAIHGRDLDAVADAVADADVAATSVGANALRHIMPALARGLALRAQRRAGLPLDIIIAENLRGADVFFRDQLKPHLAAGLRVEACVGLVRSCIGRMVPVMSERDRREDPLQIFCEPYDRVIVDRAAFRNPVPTAPGLVPVEDMDAYIDRKILIHNMGHAAVAYLGHAHDAGFTYIWQAMEESAIAQRARACMDEAAAVLAAAHPGVFSAADFTEYIEDLLERFRNRALGDTITRVGRDLARKLGREERLIGTLRLGARHGLRCPAIAGVVLAALRFARHDAESPAGDAAFLQAAAGERLEQTLRRVSIPPPTDAADEIVLRTILEAAGA